MPLKVLVAREINFSLMMGKMLSEKAPLFVCAKNIYFQRQQFFLIKFMSFVL